jgi:membrane associated rhomboid family serine protease
LTDESKPDGGQSRASMRDRLLLALAKPEHAAKAGYLPATLVAYHEPMAVLEWLGFGKGLLVLKHAAVPTGELHANLERVLQAHDKGLLFVCVAGGDAAVVDELRAADAKTRHRENIGLYHLSDDGKLRWAAGRRLGELEKACRKLPDSAPLSADDVTALIELGRREREEATTFVQGTSHRFPHLTVALIAICVLLFAATSGNDERAHRLLQLLENTPDGVRAGELWRLVTYAFLHGNTTHLLVNALSLYSLGAFLEPLLGRGRLALLCFVTTLAGGIASTLFTNAPSVGASGMVWGLVGATFGLLSKRHHFFPALIARSMRQRLVVILLINLLISFLPGIDRYCHFGGGIAGYLVALVFLRRSPRAARA